MPKRTEGRECRLLEGMEKPRRGKDYHSAGQMKFGFANQCQVSGSPEIGAIAQAFTDANRGLATSF